MDFLDNIIKSISASFVTFVSLIVIISVFSIAYNFMQKDKQHKFVNYAPVLLTSIGIFGTFFGVLIGLSHFDHENIDGSISLLLAGLKTAFFTSVFGMLMSITFKTIQTLRKDTDQTTIEETTPADIFNIMGQQNINLKNLVDALGGETDTSILSQIKLLRSDMNDSYKLMLKSQQETSESSKNIETSLSNQKKAFREFSDKLWIKLQDFADILSKSATETIIDALRQVIVDFNKNLTEQFGDNFKELNNAVIELVKWQDNYKQQLEEMIEQYKLGVTSITATEASVQQISMNTQTIPVAMADLKAIMDVNQHQINELQNHLHAFSEMRDKAVEAVPIINEQIDKTVRAVAGSVEIASNHYNTLLSESDKYIQNHINASNDFVNKMTSSSNDISKTLIEANQHLVTETNSVRDNVVKSIENLQERLEASIEHLFSEHTASLTKVFNNIDSALKGQVERTGEAVEKQLGLIDDSMQEEINRVMNHMGKALGQISNQFVNDYTRLVSEMQTVVTAHRN